MGGDGGSIPSRIDQVRTKKRDQRLERDLENQIKWKMCALTQQRLKRPVVICELGRLYNKEALLEAMLEKRLGEHELTQHLHSLKDVKTANLTDNPAFKDVADKGGEYVDMNASEFICPVTGLELNGMYRFILLWSCGCVLSEKAVKELKGDKCHACGKKFAENEDMVILNPTGDELAEQIIQMNDRRARLKAAKKDKKSKAVAAEAGAACTSADGWFLGGIKQEPTVPGGKVKTESGSTAASSKTTGAKKRPLKSEKVEPTTDNAAATCSKSVGVDVSKKSKSASIQNDPNASRVFKGLFTTSEQAKKKVASHWVTFNPAYF